MTFFLHIEVKYTWQLETETNLIITTRPTFRTAPVLKGEMKTQQNEWMTYEESRLFLQYRLTLFLKYTEAIKRISTWDTKSFAVITSCIHTWTLLRNEHYPYETTMQHGGAKNTMRQEQKPGLLSDSESAASAGFRRLSSPLIELTSNEYIAGRSEAESAIAARKNGNQLGKWRFGWIKLGAKRKGFWFKSDYQHIGKRSIAILRFCVEIPERKMAIKESFISQAKKWKCIKWIGTLVVVVCRFYTVLQRWS